MNKHPYISTQSASFENKKEEIEQGKSYMLLVLTILALAEMVNAAVKWWW